MSAAARVREVERAVLSLVVALSDRERARAPGDKMTSDAMLVTESVMLLERVADCVNESDAVTESDAKRDFDAAV